MESPSEGCLSIKETIYGKRREQCLTQNTCSINGSHCDGDRQCPSNLAFFRNRDALTYSLHPFCLHYDRHKHPQTLLAIRLGNVSKGQYKAFKTSNGPKGNIWKVLCQKPRMAPAPREVQSLMSSGPGVSSLRLSFSTKC